MLERGDFIVPYFNNQTRFDKPPLIYWLQDAAYKLFGARMNSPRGCPAGYAGRWRRWWSRYGGAQLYDPKTGWRAALMFGLCMQTILHAHAAVADMAMIAASTASAWAGWNWLKTGRRRWWLAFWGLLAVGFLAKGPIAWVPIGMTAWTAGRLKRPKAGAGVAARRGADARPGGDLGHPGADPHPRRVRGGRPWEACGAALGRAAGGAWAEDVVELRGDAAVLPGDGMAELLPMVALAAARRPRSLAAAQAMAAARRLTWSAGSC